MINVKPICDFNMKNVLVELKYDACNCYGLGLDWKFKKELSYPVQKMLLLAITCLELVQKFKYVTQMFNNELVWDFDVENIPIKLQYLTGNLWRVIVFIMCCRVPHAKTKQWQYPTSLRGWGVRNIPTHSEYQPIRISKGLDGVW